VGIVEMALVIVAEDLVRLGAFLELDLGFRTFCLGDFIGMVLESSLSVGLLDLVRGRTLIDREEL
jgi:hypothetical protein